MSDSISRRKFIAASAVGAAALTSATSEAGEPRPNSAAQPNEKPTPTRFQISCMTLPYSRFPLARALQGLRTAGYAHVAWGTTLPMIASVIDLTSMPSMVIS